MDFATLPPEINSGRMYSGPGAGSLTDAAAAWDGLAARLRAAAADYRALASTRPALAGAAAPYLDWLDGVVERSERAATRLAAAAAAHRSAVIRMVPPPAVTTNRARRGALARDNRLAQAAPAIAELDAGYERMWVRDADAMYAYARASAAAAALAPFTSPPGAPAATAGTWALRSAPDVVATGTRVMSAIPEALQALSQSPPTSLNASLAPVTPPLSRLSSLSAPSDSALRHLNSLNKLVALGSLLPKPRAGRAGFRAGLGRGTPIGRLSVPTAWATAAAPVAVRRGTVA